MMLARASVEASAKSSGVIAGRREARRNSLLPRSAACGPSFQKPVERGDPVVAVQGDQTLAAFLVDNDAVAKRLLKKAPESR